MRINTYIQIILLLIIIFLSGYGIVITKQNNKLNNANKELINTNTILANKVNVIYEISIKPTINNKINSIMGSSKEITLQYYFKMSDIDMEIKPDSSRVIRH